MSDDEYQPVGSGASETYPAQCSSLRKNGHVMLKGRPCKIVNMTTSKTGKHGHAKVHLTGIDIFTSKKYEDICPSTHNMDVPNTRRKDFQVISENEGYLHLMDDEGNVREDLRIPEGDLGKEIQAKLTNDDEFMVTVLTAMGEEAIVTIKNTQKKD
ncbi:eukaryotic translation initiation factor 5A-1-like [Takifugu rubripes]|uniref:Eukaryotic translation initiation factor 5A n=1 Tax=Takifugu rubripes TaxID=31033 RepID=A0A674PR57_TAKRU|nr:eukaryotic translation initiation factor 5A-1-like [Takifugu rubripes]|eukprot:XP_003962426.1 PREDICTED: eukaryotic translation initiation factor 5A-1-like [Takifugu rubripes]